MAEIFSLSKAQKEFDRVFKSFPVKASKRGEKILDTAEKHDLCILCNGYAVIQSKESNKDLFNMHIIKPVFIFPLLDGVDLGYKKLQLTAITYCEYIIISAEKYLNIIRKNPGIRSFIHQILKDDISLIIKRMGIYNEIKVEERLKRFFKLYGPYFVESKTKLSNLPISHNELSLWVGSARETVSRNLGYLQKRKIVVKCNCKNKICVDMKRLVS